MVTCAQNDPPPSSPNKAYCNKFYIDINLEGQPRDIANIISWF